MEKERKIKVLSLVALIVAVLGLTVAFASLSQMLTINGTANVNAASWDIHFENLTSDTIDDAMVNAEPTLSATKITGIDVTLTKPNDGASFLVDIVNGGTIDAKIDSVEISSLCTLQSSVESCDWDNDGEVTEEDIQKVNDNISFVVAYEDTGKILKKQDLLQKGQTKSLIIGIYYGKYLLMDDQYNGVEEATELPKRNLRFSNLSVTINYVQA